MSEYFVDDDPHYLTMARLCNEELEVFKKKQGFTWQNMTGIEKMHTTNAFRHGFFAGFEARFFKQTD